MGAGTPGNGVRDSAVRMSWRAHGCSVAGKLVVENSGFFGGKGGGMGGDVEAVMAKELQEAEGVKGDLPSAAAHGGGDFPAEEF